MVVAVVVVAATSLRPPAVEALLEVDMLRGAMRAVATPAVHTLGAATLGLEWDRMVVD